MTIVEGGTRGIERARVALNDYGGIEWVEAGIWAAGYNQYGKSAGGEEI
jgi:hypothetical protein